jgi:hypothetical protein
MNTFQTRNIFQHISRSDVLKIIVITSLAYVLLHFMRVTLLISGDDVTPFMTMCGIILPCHLHGVN